MNVRCFIPAPTPLSITNQPKNLTVEESKSATFTVVNLWHVVQATSG
jgi:hypothetical protein